MRNIRYMTESEVVFVNAAVKVSTGIFIHITLKIVPGYIRAIV